MKLIFPACLLLLLPLLPGHSGVVRAQGTLFVTGHDADNHHFGSSVANHPGTEQFITSGLDFLVFGKKAGPDQVTKRTAVRIAYLSQNVNKHRERFDLISGYTNPGWFHILDEGWKNVLAPGAFDVVIVGYRHSCCQLNDPAMAAALLGAKTDFEIYFNQGGKLYVMVQLEYGFLPRFGAQEVDLSVNTGNFFVTPDGAAIGLESHMINQDYTHHKYKNVDTSLFRIFERTWETADDGQKNLPVSIGFKGRIQDTIFIPDSVNTVLRPRSTVPSGNFTDSVCVEFFTPTDSASLAYSLIGAVTTTSPTLANNGRLCFSQTTTIRLVGKRNQWKDSPDTVFTYTVSARLPSTLALYSAGREITEVTFAEVQLEVRLTRPSGLACAGCTVQVTPTGGQDLERLPLTPQGVFYSSAFARAESLLPIVGDGTLQHGPTDSVVLTWVNPLDAKDIVRKAYPYRPKPPVIPLDPALSLFHRGQEITVVDASQKDLDIRLTLDSTEACIACPVLVFPSTGSDSESVLLTGGISPYQGSFKRDLKPRAIPGDGTIQHDRQDSIVLLYRHPLDPAKTVRRSYVFLPARDTVGIRPQNTIAHTAGNDAITNGHQWVISDAPGLQIVSKMNNGACCTIAPTPVNAQNPDSLRLVGIFVEASRGFSLDLKVFSHLGEFVNQVGFTVSEPEFEKLSAMPGRETRFMRVLWNGRARDGSLAGNGVYIFKTSIALLPVPGITQVPVTATSSRRVGILRSPE